MLAGLDSSTPISLDDARALRAVGFAFAGRYFSRNPRKNLSRGEVANLATSGLAIVSLWEAAGDQLASFSSASGARDGHDAAVEAQAVGQPLGTSIYFAIDLDVAPENLDQIVAYLRAAQVTMGPLYKVEVYGSGLVCSTMLGRGLAERSWLACAEGWRGSRDFASRATIRQISGSCHIPSVTFAIDRDEAEGDLAEIGAWPGDATQASTVPSPMRVIPSARDLQSALVASGQKLTIDGIWGPRSSEALSSYFSR